jgi:hypothetical protein
MNRTARLCVAIAAGVAVPEEEVAIQVETLRLVARGSG